MLAVKAQHPELDIRFVFQRNNTLSKQSKTTYGAWADKHGFPWCIYPDIPESWADLIIKIDQFVVTLEEEGIPFQEILSELEEYVAICRELDE